MAVEGGGPDLQSLIRNSMPHKEGPGRVFAMFSETINTTATLANPMKDKPINQLPQGRPGLVGGLADKMFAALRSIPDDVSKNIAAKVRFDPPSLGTDMNSGPTHVTSVSRDVGGDGGPNLG